MKRGTQDSNLESPVLETGALSSLASAPGAADSRLETGLQSAAARGCGGIGRRAGLRSRWGNPWGFESLQPHRLCEISTSRGPISAPPRRGRIEDGWVLLPTTDSERAARLSLGLRMRVWSQRGRLDA